LESKALAGTLGLFDSWNVKIHFDSTNKFVQSRFWNAGIYSGLAPINRCDPETWIVAIYCDLVPMNWHSPFFI